jgi:hypothetical protein
MRLLLPSPDQATDPFDPECFDFVTYLARRHGFERSDVVSVGQRWLTTYEPSSEARRAFGREVRKSWAGRTAEWRALGLTGTGD